MTLTLPHLPFSFLTSAEAAAAAAEKKMRAAVLNSFIDIPLAACSIRSL
jgi:hypothetical protein